MFPNEGLLNLLTFLTVSASFDMKVRLFKNNHAVSEASVLGDFTESTFTGYAAQDPVWPAPAMNGFSEGEVDSPTITWTCTANIAAQQAFGLYVTFTASGGGDRLLCAYNFAAPQTIAFIGDAVTKKLDLFNKDFVP